MAAFSHQTLAAFSNILETLANSEDVAPTGRRHRLNLSTYFGYHQLDYERYRSSWGSDALAIEYLLIDVNRESKGAGQIKELIENSLSSYYHFGDTDLLSQHVDSLNSVLRFDGYRLEFVNKTRYRLVLAEDLLIPSQLKKTSERLGLDSVETELRRALDNVSSDPEDALTAACSMVMSVCTTMLERMERSVPRTRDIGHLTKELAAALDLSPERKDIADNIKSILGSLANLAFGIGALRTRGGDAEGRGEKVKRVDARIARLAVNSAACYSLFLLETWEKRRAHGPGTK